jgi:hypothetical protein
LVGPTVGPIRTGGRPDVYVVSQTQAAEELGIDRKALAEFVRRLRIAPKPMSGKGKGLSRADVALIRKALRQIDRMAVPA